MFTRFYILCMCKKLCLRIIFLHVFRQIFMVLKNTCSCIREKKHLGSKIFIVQKMSMFRLENEKHKTYKKNRKLEITYYNVPLFSTLSRVGSLRIVCSRQGPPGKKYNFSLFFLFSFWFHFEIYKFKTI
jgi:hypothetical protein